MTSKLLDEMNLVRIAGSPERCTCDCPDGKGQHLENCHSYDNREIGQMRRAISTRIHALNNLLLANTSEQHRAAAMDWVSEIATWVHALGHAEAAEGFYHLNLDRFIR